MIPENKIQVTNKNDTNNTDHSKMDHSSMKHGANPSMGMEGHDHHAMMINDF
jgi:P-type Cu2+ transporter